MSNTPAVITAPTCRFKTKRAGAHIGIARADICGDCLAAMQASLKSLFTDQQNVFCHECGIRPQVGDLMSYIYRDVDAMILCEPCRLKWAAKLTSELDANRTDRQAMIIKSVEARAAIAAAVDPKEKLSLWTRARNLLGPRRRI